MASSSSLGSKPDPHLQQYAAPSGGKVERPYTPYVVRSGVGTHRMLYRQNRVRKLYDRYSTTDHGGKVLAVGAIQVAGQPTGLQSPGPANTT